MSRGVEIWRIATDTPGYHADDLSGKGAEKSGGRWNRKGTPLVYASVSRALACLETIVHLAGGRSLPLHRELVRITVPADLWDARTVFDPQTHPGWDALPAGSISADWGTSWANARRTLLAEVPSVIVPEESNFLVNPRVVELVRLKSQKVRQWTYDPRIPTSVE